MKTQTLKIPGTYRYFLDWLNRYTLPSAHYPPTLPHPRQLMSKYKFPTRDGGHYKIGWELWINGMLDVANYDPGMLKEPEKPLCIRAYKTPLPPDAPIYADLNRGEEAIILEIDVLDEDAIQVRLYCYLDEVQDYFYELLMGIAERWGDKITAQFEIEHLREMPRLADAADKAKWEAILNNKISTFLNNENKTKKPRERDPMNLGTKEKVVKVMLQIRYSKSKLRMTDACELVGIDPDTYKRWKDDLGVLDLFERKKQDYEKCKSRMSLEDFIKEF